MAERLQAADPEVSRTKFERELDQFAQLAREYQRRGWLLVEAAFPEIFVVLAAPQVKPAPVVTGALFDYTDYDLRPPSVRLVDPFTRQPYTARELPTNLRREVEADAQLGGLLLPPGAGAPRVLTQQPLMQAHGPDEIPFLCLAGVREYHEHPAHSGDRWELHRASGAGRLVRLLEIIDTYGVKPINGYAVELVPQINGLTQGAAPR